METNPGTGEHFGRYRIVRQIGHGGMGVVYEAWDDTLGRAVALKIVRSTLADTADYRARFEREASLLARIRSRHIVQVHDYGSEGHAAYLVTELFRDGDLQTHLASRGPLDKVAAVRLVAQVCEALQDAHDVGVLHRDIKPSNVLLWRRDRELIPYLCDFGIASDGNSSLTMTGSIVGSLGYMAPERHQGLPADVKGDVYAAGCLLWAAVTGTAPYSGTDFQVMNGHINESIPQLGTGRPVDAELDALFRDAMAKDPADRVGSAAELRDRLLAIAAAQPSLGAPPPAPTSPGTTPPSDVAPTVLKPASGPVDLAVPAADAVAADVDSDSDVTPDDFSETYIGAPPAPAAPPPEPVPEPEPRRRTRLVIGAVAAAAVVVGIPVAAVLTSDSDAPTPTPTSPTSSSPSLTPPAALEAQPEPAYRGVAFTVPPPTAPPGAETSVQFRAGQTWKPVKGKQITVPIGPRDTGGAQVCITIRPVVSADGQTATGPVSKVCGKSAAPEFEAVRLRNRVVRLRLSGYPVRAQVPVRVVYGECQGSLCVATPRVRTNGDGRAEWLTPGAINGQGRTITIVVRGSAKTFRL